MNKADRFEYLKNELETQSNKLSEAKGKLSVLKQNAKEEFGTDDIENLEKLQDNYEKEENELSKKKEELEEEIENLLNDIQEE